MREEMLTPDEKELWRRFKRETGVSDQPGTEWETTKRSGAIDPYLAKPTPEGFARIKDILLGLYRKKPGRKGKSSFPPMRSLLRQREIQRAEVTSDYFVRLASEDPEVLAVRQRLFGGALLDEAQAEHFLEQVGPRHFPLEWFQKHRIPLLDHTSVFADPKHGRITDCPRPSTRVHFEWHGKSRKYMLPISARRSRWDRLTFPSPLMPRQFSSGSVVDEIRKVAKTLEDQFDWDLRAARDFILSGTRPRRLPPIRLPDIASFQGIHPSHTHFIIKLRIDPWVSAESVKNVYQAIQRFLWEKQHRPLTTESLCFFEFVVEYLTSRLGLTPFQIQLVAFRHPTAVKVPWRELTEEWNAEHASPMKTRMSAGKARERFCELFRNIVFPLVVPAGLQTDKRRDQFGEDFRESLEWLAKITGGGDD